MSQRKSRQYGPFASRRRAAVREAAGEVKIDALLVSRPEDVGYLTGFSGQDSFLLLWRDGRACLITDGRYAEQAGRECGGVEIHVRDGPMPAAVADVWKAPRTARLGVQADHVTIAGRGRLAGQLGRRRIVAVANVTRRLRMVKEPPEIRAVRKAIIIAERAFKELIARGAEGLVGRTEREVAAELDYRMRLAGADGAAFETIVAAGPNGSRPHYRPGSAVIARDAPVLIDWGAKVRGYVSDLTRVVFVGRIPPKLGEVYAVVLRGQAAGMGAARPGAGCDAVDAAARKLIERAGYGGQFRHGLGHGIGREVHEAPALARTDKTRLRAGMIVTVEPGIYLPGVGGVRIEDDVLITSGGRRRLSRLPAAIEAMTLK